MEHYKSIFENVASTSKQATHHIQCQRMDVWMGANTQPLLGQPFMPEFNLLSLQPCVGKKARNDPE